MHINSLYIHIKGILDNLASILNIQLNLNIKNKNFIVLNNDNFLNSLKANSLEISNLIENDYKIWLKEIKIKRDPIAHREPLFIPYTIIINEQENSKFNEINARLSNEKNVKNMSSILHELQNNLPFKPYFVQYDGSKIYDIEETITRDIKVIKELFIDLMTILTRS